MSPQTRKILRIIVDNAFWIFVALMIILGTVLPNPFIAATSGG
jgi:TRAP-type C4-dicarboxylate transport system permease small subunit